MQTVRTRSLGTHSRRLVMLAVFAGAIWSAGDARADRFERFVEGFKERCAAITGKHKHRAKPKCENDWERAGNPHCVAPWAKCFPNKKYAGYYVGGSSPLYADEASCFHGERRRFHEGTFGLDYHPRWSRVRLQWLHPCR